MALAVRSCCARPSACVKPTKALRRAVVARVAVIDMPHRGWDSVPAPQEDPIVLDAARDPTPPPSLKSLIADPHNLLVYNCRLAMG